MDALTVLYTYDIGGEFHRLPRLHTFIKRLQSDVNTPTLLVDLGAACDPAVEICAITEGRSAYIMLDAMGYHAANVSGVLTDDARAKLAPQLTLALVDAGHSWRYHVPPVSDEGMIISAIPTPAHRLCIQITPNEQTALVDHRLTFAPIPRGHVGMVGVRLTPIPHLTDQQVLTVPETTRPDPTITASLQFVESEADYYRRQG